MATDLAPGRVIRVTVITIGNAIMIAVAVVPVSAFAMPRVRPFNPLRLIVIIARMIACPASRNPDLVAAAPVPVPRHPGVAVSRRGDESILILHRRRPDVDEEINVGSCQSRNRNTPHRCYEQRSQQGFTHKSYLHGYDSVAASPLRLPATSTQPDNASMRNRLTDCFVG